MITQTIKYGLFAFFILTLLSCEKTNTITETRNKTLIINAFPETGQTISNFSIRKFNDNGAFTLPVNDLSPRIVWKNNSFGLIPSGNKDGLYRMAAENFEFLPLNQYRLEIENQGEFITGQTIMPAEISDFDIDNSIIDIYNTEGALNDDINLAWRKDDSSVYSISIIPLEENPDNLISFSDINPAEVISARQELDQPFSANSFSLNPAAFEYYGDNVIELISIDDQYADFFELNENGTTFSNIKNGKGYFVGLSKFSIIVKVQ